MHTHNTSCKGFSLLELLLVLVIATSVLMGGLYVHYMIKNDQRIETTKENIEQIINGTRKLYAGRPDYGATGTDITPRVARAGVLPASTPLQSNNALRGEFGNISIFSENFRFIVTVRGLPEKACVTLITDINTANNRSVQDLKIEGNNAWICDYTLTNLTNLCADEGNTVHWVISDYTGGGNCPAP